MKRILAATALTVFLGGCAATGTASLSPTLAPTASPAPSASPAPTAETLSTPTPSAAIGACPAASVAVRILSWDGAAGHRTAHVELTNAGSVACLVESQPKPQLVAGDGSVLTDGTATPGSPLLTVAAGGTLSSIVQDDNYCGPDPVAPVTVAFVFTGGGRIVATPESPTDTSGVPPCMGPGNPGVIEMQPFAP
jgi:hypothetical protein